MCHAERPVALRAMASHLAALREHLAAGRLTIDEFDERLDNAYAAKTLGELDELMADLPGTDLQKLPDASLDRSAGNPPLPRRRPGGPIALGPCHLPGAWDQGVATT